MHAFAWPMWPLRPIVLAALVIFALVPTHAEQAPTLLQLGADPYGLIWSPVMRIPINGQCHNRDLFIPGLAVDQTTAGSRAKLALTFY